YAASVVAVSVRQNYVLDRSLVLGGQQLMVFSGMHRDRGVDDDVAFICGHHERVTKALDHADGLVDLDYVVANSHQVGGIVGMHSLLTARDKDIARWKNDHKNKERSEERRVGKECRTMRRRR